MIMILIYNVNAGMPLFCMKLEGMRKIPILQKCIGTKAIFQSIRGSERNICHHSGSNIAADGMQQETLINVIDASTHSTDSEVISHLIQLFLRLCLHSSYVIHRQINPFVNRAEQLSVKVGKQTLLHLDT